MCAFRGAERGGTTCVVAMMHDKLPVRVFSGIELRDAGQGGCVNFAGDLVGKIRGQMHRIERSIAGSNEIYSGLGKSLLQVIDDRLDALFGLR